MLGSPWIPVQAQTPPRIEKMEIRHVGPPATSDDLIRANVHVKVGDPYNRLSVDEDVRTLYSTGYFFNVRVAEERTTDGGYSLTYVVQGKPRLTEIQFVGNKKYSRSKLLKKISSKVGEPLDERKLFSDTQEILKYYQKAGLQKTQVKYTPNIDENAGRGSVTFEITESPKVKIDRVDFAGAQAFPQKKLRKTIKTRRHWMFSWLTGSGVLKDDQFEDDKEKLGEFYRNAGYIDFELKDVKFVPVKPKWMDIRFEVSEGRQYKVGAIEFKGNKLYTADQIMRGVVYQGKPIRPEMTVGKTFTPTGLTKDIEAIQDFYGARGYIDTRIVAIKTPNTERGTMDLVYEIEELDKSSVEKVEIKGNIKTKDRVIRRELAISPGEPFDMVRVKISKRRLEGLDYFERVETQGEPTDVPNRKNLVIGVEEKNTGNVTMGAGFSTVDSVIGFVELNQGNFDLFKPPYFMGGGQKFRIRAQVGTQRQDYLLTFIEPWFLQQRLALSVDLYHRRLDYLSDYYDERLTGARLGLTRSLGSDFLIGGISYTVENVGMVNVSDYAKQFIPAPDIGYSLISKVGASLAYDTRNHAQMPDRGQRTEITSEVAGGPLGGDRDFYKIELHSSWYFKGLFEGHIIEVNGRTGVVDNYDDQGVPFFERWFLGGMYSLRGFKFRHVGPRDVAGGTLEPIGGNTYVFGSIEYSLPIIERLRFAVFYDIGTINSAAYNFSMSDYNDNWGVGLRINIPGLGPLRFDYGLPITAGPYNSHSGRFNFGVGYTREF
jgi:outer membrane protein insertion porin family